jgi:hypothetical protein
VQPPSAKDQDSARSLFRSSKLCLRTALTTISPQGDYDYLRKIMIVSR